MAWWRDVDLAGSRSDQRENVHKIKIKISSGENESMDALSLYSMGASSSFLPLVVV
jgi:hypothetical protein